MIFCSVVVFYADVPIIAARAFRPDCPALIVAARNSTRVLERFKPLMDLGVGSGVLTVVSGLHLAMHEKGAGADLTFNQTETQKLGLGGVRASASQLRGHCPHGRQQGDRSG
jgi:hypothetical protein